MIGSKLGPYEILAPLGAGGMGEVYRARDTRLGRDVAIKVVLAAGAHDPDRLRRFEQEARAASALNQANLLTVFDVGSHDGAPYLVTELLDGLSLRERLAEGPPIPWREAADWGAQVARGLAAAHEKGIVHRDLKPENLFLCADGRVKILDFGLAKLTMGESGALADATTLAGGETATGVILGTAGYMAPEQVRGERIDHRADLFALGCVLYELFGGRRAFHGETAIESLNAILKEEPRPLAALRPDLPDGLARLVERCLEKSPARRFRDAADLAWALEGLGASSATATPAATRSTPRRGSWQAAVAIAAALGAVAGITATQHRRPSRSGNDVASWRGERMIGGAVIAFGPRPSPDGSLVAFMTLDEGSQSQVAVLRPGESRFTILTHSRDRGPATMINWSPDGRTVYFNRAITGAIYGVPALGGEERLVVEHANRPVPLADGSLLGLRGVADGIYRLLHLSSDRVRSEPVGPEFVELPAPGPEGTLAAFPDGREAVHFGLRKEDIGRRGPGLWAIDLSSGRSRELAPGLEFPRAGDQVAPPAVAVDPTTDEALVVVQHGDLFVVTSVPRTGGGAPRPLLYLTAPPFFLAVGRDGAIYADPVEVFGSLVKVDPERGEVRRLARFTGLPGLSTSPVELPDGGVLFTGIDGGVGRLLVARPGRAPVPFSELAEESSGPACLVDDAHVAFFVGPAARRQIAIATLDGRLVRRVPLPAPGVPNAFAAWGDGKSVLYGLGGRLLVVDTASGAHREIVAAETGALDPRSGELVVVPTNSATDVRTASYPRFARFGRDGSRRETYEVAVEGYPEAWGASVLDIRGRLVVSLGASDTWWVAPGWIDLPARRLHRVPITIDGDLFSPSWARDGSILAIAWEYSVNAWRFTRESGAPRS